MKAISLHKVVRLVERASFSSMARLQTALPCLQLRIRAMVKVMWKEEVPKGTALIQQGDLQERQ